MERQYPLMKITVCLLEWTMDEVLNKRRLKVAIHLSRRSKTPRIFLIGWHWDLKLTLSSDSVHSWDGKPLPKHSLLSLSPDAHVSETILWLIYEKATSVPYSSDERVAARSRSLLTLAMPAKKTSSSGRWRRFRNWLPGDHEAGPKLTQRRFVAHLLQSSNRIVFSPN